MNYDLSIIIPARREEWLNKTIEDILKNKRGKTQIIVGLDGDWPEAPIQTHPDVVILYYPESIGQRAITKQCARISKAKFIAKTDAHCAFDEGFDVKMLEAFETAGDNVVICPTMRNLWVFNWVCPDGHTRYQGQSGICKECGKETVKDVVWIAKTNPHSWSYCFDSEPHFQYFQEYKKRAVKENNLTESMSLQGSFFMMTRDKYFELDIDDESFGSWGSQGLTVACKFWLSGGRVLINHSTWYAHCFRTAGGDFGFPYPNPGSKVQDAKKYARDLFFNNKWDKQTRPLSWLVEKFWPIPGWSDEDLKKIKEKDSAVGKGLSSGILYYTDNQINMKLAKTCRIYIKESGLPITSVSLKKMDFGRNIHLHLKRGRETMFKQILAGLEAMTEDIIFFCEHDVIYHKSHFDFIPPSKDKFYYNNNNWRVRDDGFAVKFDHDSTSQMCAYRELLIEEYRKIVAQGKDYKGSYEPGTRDKRSDRWESAEANLDIRHTNNLTENRWSTDKFRNKATCQNWQESTIDKVTDINLETIIGKKV